MSWPQETHVVNGRYLVRDNPSEDWRLVDTSANGGGRQVVELGALPGYVPVTWAADMYHWVQGQVQEAERRGRIRGLAKGRQDMFDDIKDYCNKGTANHESKSEAGHDVK